MSFHPHLNLCFLGCLLGLMQAGPSQSQEISNPNWAEMGNPIIENYTHFDYQADPYTVKVTQDKRGIIYFTNIEGLIAYDGAQFKKIKTILSRIWTIEIAGDTLWVGGQGAFGYNVLGANGEIKEGQGKMLSNQLPDSIRQFSLISRIVRNQGTTYFLNSRYLFSWNGERLTVRPARAVHRPYLFSIAGKVYFTDGTELIAVDEKGERSISSWSAFEDRVVLMVPYDERKMLVGGPRSGLHLFDGESFTPFAPHLFEITTQNRLYDGTRINDELIALATNSKGVLLIEQSGRFCQWIGKDQGLNSNSITSLGMVEDGSLWATTKYGISKIELQAPYTSFDQKNGLHQPPMTIARHEKVLYIGTADGVYFLNPPTENYINPGIQKLEGTFDRTNDFESTTGGLVVANSRSHLSVIRNFREQPIDPGPTGIVQLERLQDYPNLLFAVNSQGLYLLELVNGRWQFLDEISQMKGAYGITSDQQNQLWLRRAFDMVRLTPDPDLVYQGKMKEAWLNQAYDIKFYGEDYGMKSWPKARAAHDKLYFINDGIVSSYDPEADTIGPDYSFGPELLSTETTLFEIVEGTQKDVWFIASAPKQLLTDHNGEVNESITNPWLYVHAIQQPDGTYKWDNLPFQAIQREYGPLKAQVIGGETIATLLVEDDVVWFGGISGKLLRFDPQKFKIDPDPFPLFIKEISTLREGQQVYNGFSDHITDMELPYRQNSLRFEFGGVSYQMSDSIYYRHQLEGLDDDWSVWSHDTRIDYTGLREGQYALKIQAINPYGQNGQEARVDFVIEPPWYRTWWAYALYALGVGGMVYLIIALRVRQLKRDRDHLEEVVHQRTIQLEQQAEQLKELDQIKTRFFANISHEFRTPLTLIRGPLRRMINGTFSGDQRAVWPLMFRNANRLLHLINQLLDLSKLEAAKMQLRAQQQDMVYFLQLITSNYHSLADSKRIEFNYYHRDTELTAYFDTDKMEKVCHNLLSNAFKFTAENGSVKVFLGTKEVDGINMIEIEVKDSGIGIPADQQDKIFERFHQVDDSHTREQEGTGIGMALVKELVELHHGRVELESEPGKGTTITVLIPLGKDHLHPSEILAHEEKVELKVDEEFVTSIFQEESSMEIEHEENHTPENAPDLLIVEDNPDMRQFLKMTLSEEYRITEAVDGQHGLDTARENIPDLIISDVMMPKMDGIELCEKLKTDELTSHIPVILLTAKADRSSKLEGLVTGADDYLSKPFDQDELLIIIKNRIAQRRKLREKFKSITNIGPKDISVTPADQRFLERIMEIMEEHMGDSEYSVEDFAGDVGMSPRHMQRKIVALIDQSPSQFMRTMRLKRAAQLLGAQSDTVSQVAYEVGFNNLSYFTKCFKEQYQMTPIEYYQKGSST